MAACLVNHSPAALFLRCRFPLFSKDMVQVLRACLQLDPEDRPSAEDAMKLPYFADLYQQQQQQQQGGMDESPTTLPPTLSFTPPLITTESLSCRPQQSGSSSSGVNGQPASTSYLGSQPVLQSAASLASPSGPQTAATPKVDPQSLLRKSPSLPQSLPVCGGVPGAAPPPAPRASGASHSSLTAPQPCFVLPMSLPVVMGPGAAPPHLAGPLSSSPGGDKQREVRVQLTAPDAPLPQGQRQVNMPQGPTSNSAKPACQGSGGGELPKVGHVSVSAMIIVPYWCHGHHVPCWGLLYYYSTCIDSM